MEGQSFRTIAKNLTVNYRNVYYMIKSYKEHGLDGIRSKRIMLVESQRYHLLRTN